MTQEVRRVRDQLEVELAPQHKTGLRLKNPILTSAGCYGMGTEYRRLVDDGGAAAAPLGAVVVGPLTMHPRRGAAPPRAVPFPAGVLLHTGLANPGLPTALRRYGRAWERSPVPVIVHLAATSPDEVEAACERLSAIEAVAAVEIGLRDGAEADEAAALVALARPTVRQPLLARLPLADAARLAEPVSQAGADALTVAAPPRGTVLYRGQFITGRLYGPFVLPLALRALRQVAETVAVPLVGCGGAFSPDQAMQFFRAGAAAVQLDAVLWRDPAGTARIAREVAARLGGPNA
jgi:dihydroorotate dehydrogenase (NAD+) catalytic subunit